MARYKVKVGYHYIGANRASFAPGHVFEHLTEEEAGDQIWKLEKLASRKKDEAPGTDSMGRVMGGAPVEEKLPPVRSEEEIAADEAEAVRLETEKEDEAARLEAERLEKEKEDEDPEDDEDDEKEEKKGLFTRKKRKKE